MSVAKAIDVAYVRFRAPDLSRMRSFLTDFGMTDALPEQDQNCIYMRGGSNLPFLHATELGDPGFVALGIRVRDRADLERLSAHDGVPVEELDSPGGGLVVRLTDPDAFCIEAVAGQSRPLPTAPPPTAAWNQGDDVRRIASRRRVSTGKSHVQRLGHCAFNVSDFRRSEAWYKERFGLLTSDEIHPEPGIADGAFLRCDRGDEPCDHHTIVLSALPDAGITFMHSAFEVVDLDDLMAGHDFLLRAGHKLHWGVGRHVLGSQIFDYWLDPWGHEIEHWTDGDQLRAADGGGVATVEELLAIHWGPPPPQSEH